MRNKIALTARHFALMMVFCITGSVLADTTEIGGYIWFYDVSDGHATVTGVSPTDGEMEIPSEIGGMAVREIGSYAFYSCVGLTNVIVPSTVTNIGEYAFFNCTNLVSVTLNDGLRSISTGAFANCRKLTSIDIPSSVEEIGERYPWISRYDMARRLRYDKLKEYAASFEDNWQDIASLPEMTVVTNNTSAQYLITVECSSEEELAKESEYIGFSAEVSIQDPATTPGAGGSMSSMSFTNIYSKASRCNMSWGVFEGCVALEDVYLKNGIVTIGGGAFRNCTSLRNMVIPDTVKSIGGYGVVEVEELGYPIRESNTSWPVAGAGGSMSGAILEPRKEHSFRMIEIESGVFQGCTSLTNAVLSINLEYLGPYAFAGCVNLQSIKLPDSLRSINQGSFSGCESLAHIRLPTGLEIIGAYEWSPCYIARGYKRNGGDEFIEDETWYGADGVVTNISTLFRPRRDIVNAVTNIAHSTVMDNRWQVNADEIVIPSAADYYCRNGSEYGIVGCDCLEELALFTTSINSYMIQKELLKRRRFYPSFSNYVQKYRPLDEYWDVRVHINSEGILYEWDYLPNNRIAEFMPDSGVFYGCKSLTAIELPSSVRRIADYAFYDCPSLSAVSVPSDLEVVGRKAFGGITSLPELGLPWEGYRDVISSWLTNGQPISGLGDALCDIAEEIKINAEMLSEDDETAILRMVNNCVAFAFREFRINESTRTFEGLGDVLDGVASVVGAMGKLPSAEYVEAILRIVDSVNMLFVNNCDASQLRCLTSFNGIGEIFNGVAHVIESGRGGISSELRKWVVQSMVDITGQVADSLTGNIDEMQRLESLDGLGGIFSAEASVIAAIGSGISSEQRKWIMQQTLECWSLVADSIDRISASNPSLEPLVAIEDVCNGLADVVETMGISVLYVPAGIKYCDLSSFSQCGKLKVISFEGNAPINLGDDPGASSVIVQVSYGSTGWDVGIPGTWHGLKIEYANPALDISAFGMLNNIVSKGVTDIVIPNYVTAISSYAFDGCASLTNIVFEGDAPNGSLSGLPSSCVIRVPRNAIGWNVEIPGTWQGVRIEYNKANLTIENGVLTGVVLNGDTEVEIPDSVVRVGEHAFDGCDGITSIAIPGSVEAISPAAFDGCEKLWAKWFRTLERLSAEDLVAANAVSLTVTNVVVHYVATATVSEAVTPDTTSTGIVNVVAEVSAGKPVAIPSEWAEQYPAFAEKFGDDFTAAITMKTGKRDGAGNAMLVWQDFVAGTDPTKEDDVFRADITFDAAGNPIISWTPELPPGEAAKRSYKKYGKVKLNDAEWSLIDGNEADYNFFKVSVEMK